MQLYSRPVSPAQLLRRFLPWKGDPMKELIRKVLFLFFLAVFIVSIVFLARYILSDYTTGREYNDAQELFDGGTPAVDVDMPAGYRQQFGNLYSANADICGWLKIDGTAINYPVVQGEDDDFYLTHTFRKSENRVGVPFLEYLNDFTPDGMNHYCTIYAHNMKSGKMFHDLRYYKDVEYYKEHPLVSFNTVYEDYDWKIIGLFFTPGNPAQEDALFYHQRLENESTEEFYEFINALMQRSYFTTGVDVNENDHFLFLSTCDTLDLNSRIVLAARRVRPGESAEVDVSAAEQNYHQYFPRNYTDRIGSTYHEPDTNWVFYRPDAE